MKPIFNHTERFKPVLRDDPITIQLRAGQEWAWRAVDAEGHELAAGEGKVPHDREYAIRFAELKAQFWLIENGMTDANWIRIGERMEVNG